MSDAIPRPDPKAALWRAEMIGGKNEFRELRSRFYLEDESGRILVDCGDVKFGGSFGGFFSSRIQNIALLRGKETRKGPGNFIIEIHSLKEGQEAYVLGTVRPDQTSGELKVAPAKDPIERALFDRLFPSKFTQDPSGHSSTFLVSDARESLTWLALKKTRKQALLGSLAWLVFCGVFMVSELSLIGPGQWLPARMQAFLDGPPPPPPPPAPLPHDMIFTVTGRHYMGYWITGPDTLGSVNGNWLPAGIEALQKRVAGAAPRIVVVIEAGGAEQKLIEALKPLKLRVEAVPLSALEEYAASVSGTATNIWTQGRFAAHYAGSRPAP